jgi:hypothetical protein
MYNINKKSEAINVKENMEIIGEKLLTTTRSTYSRENKCSNRQIEQTGDYHLKKEIFQII